MELLDDIIATKNTSELDKLIKTTTEIDFTKIFFQLFTNLLKLNIDQLSYISLLNILIFNNFNISKVLHIKKMIIILDISKLPVAYKYTLLSFVDNDLSLRINEFKNIMHSTNISIINTICNETPDISEFITKIMIYLEAYNEKFNLKLKNKKNIINDDTIINTTPKYDHEYIEHLWTIENGEEIIHRLSLLVKYFGKKLLSHTGVKLITIDTASTLNYDELCKYYLKTIKTLFTYFERLQKIITLIDNIKIMLNLLITTKMDINVDKFKFVTNTEDSAPIKITKKFKLEKANSEKIEKSNI